MLTGDRDTQREREWRKLRKHPLWGGGQVAILQSLLLHSSCAFRCVFSSCWVRDSNHTVGHVGLGRLNFHTICWPLTHVFLTTSYNVKTLFDAVFIYCVIQHWIQYLLSNYYQRGPVISGISLANNNEESMSWIYQPWGVGLWSGPYIQDLHFYNTHGLFHSAWPS